MTIIAIDPGPEQSAYIVWDAEAFPCFGIVSNEDLRAGLKDNRIKRPVVCESIESYGMPVGKDVFRTCYEIGRFQQVVESGGAEFHLLPRREVKLQLCGSSRAKDPNVRQALLDRFPATGGGATPQVGTKSQPGPLYGIKSHLWSALAVAVAWTEIQREKAA